MTYTSQFLFLYTYNTYAECKTIRNILYLRYYCEDGYFFCEMYIFLNYYVDFIPCKRQRCKTRKEPTVAIGILSRRAGFKSILFDPEGSVLFMEKSGSFS